MFSCVCYQAFKNTGLCDMLKSYLAAFPDFISLAGVSCMHNTAGIKETNLYILVHQMVTNDPHSLNSC